MCVVCLMRLLILRELLHTWVHFFPLLLIHLGFSSHQAKMFFPFYTSVLVSSQSRLAPAAMCGPVNIGWLLLFSLCLLSCVLSRPGSFRCPPWHVICKPLTALFASARPTQGHGSERCWRFHCSSEWRSCLGALGKCQVFPEGEKCLLSSIYERH